MSMLFSPFALGDLKLKNRVVMAPMCMNVAVDGLVNEWHLIHYATRAIGGVGLIIVEATAVDSYGRISKDDLGIWSDEHIEGHRVLVSHMKQNGAACGIQLGHAGRKARLDYGRLIAPSPLAFNAHYGTPDAMSLEDIQTVVTQFADAAKRALDAGYELIELHGAHGYLINEFLSPLTNERTDAYGGSLENRSRFLLDIVKAVRGVWPEPKPLIVRFSAEEYDEAGNHARDIAAVCQLLKPYGIHMAHVSSGGVIDKGVNAFPGYQVGMSDVVRRQGDVMTIAGGLITDPNQANDILLSQAADLIFLGRELLRNPYWTLNAARTLGVELPWPKPYERARASS